MQNTIKGITLLATTYLSITGCISQTKANKTSFWNGRYELNTLTDEIMNGINVGTNYEINVKGDSCLFTGDGIQYAFSDKCFIRSNKDTLLGYFCYDTDGFIQYHERSVPLFKIFRKDTNYYIISSAILEDTTKTYLVKHTPESEKIQ
ncbi:hypothetical protein HF329_29400 [Chitinophaga oryzae]|uniref:Lipoprotein n=1 Tax=Chitinophaga oryzae TaxID=2725414 RepID=A0AAE6ZM08_9BACT|nr:DUF5991 domain-containing protein [Chitinophaga oryzae]QJB35197.1 hypothetical protein HF329_29400 [Chitinophaga oryzae]